MPAYLPEHDNLHLTREAFSGGSAPRNWQGILRNTGILLGILGIACLPIFSFLGIALIVGGMEFIWLASPGLV